MILEHLSILNYKNISQADLVLSPNVNCFIGNNGMGKTNVLDAVYYLSFCKSSNSQSDAQNIQHDEEFFLLQGTYRNIVGEPEMVSCGVKRGQRKHFKRNDKEYKRLAEHLGLIPLVMISPSDSELITGTSEERRRFMDMIVCQYSTAYVDALMRYQKTLQQRNALLKQECEPDWSLCDVLEDMMDADARVICRERRIMVEEFVSVFRGVYRRLCNNDYERVDIHYESHDDRGSLRDILRGWRERERIIGHTLHGPHKDNLELLLNGYNVRREGSQGQMKTYFIAMKLAQFLYLTTKGKKQTPILLLDDIFDKLDAGRVACIVDYVSGDAFEQIFITDTNRDHLDRILSATRRDYRLFHVENGHVELTQL